MDEFNIVAWLCGVFVCQPRGDLFRSLMVKGFPNQSHFMDTSLARKRKPVEVVAKDLGIVEDGFVEEGSDSFILTGLVDVHRRFSPTSNYSVGVV